MTGEMEMLIKEKKEQDTGVIKILAVDDREDNLFSIETILEGHNYLLRTALSGREALKILLKEHDFTLILMDVQMPGLSGLETAELIHERDILKDIPIIFITANDQSEENLTKGYELGCVDYIYKPINPDLLRNKIFVFADLYKKTHELKLQEAKLKQANDNLAKEVETRKSSEEKVKVLNQQLVENIYQLKVINKELERFAYVASHDLQEPIRKIILFTKMLKDKYAEQFDDKADDLLQRIIRSSGRMQQLVKNLLHYSRTVVDKGDYVETDLNEIVKEVITDLDELIADKDAKITVDSLPTVKIIPEHFRQVFQNLISNALKFCKDDVNPEVSLTYEKCKGMYIEGMTYDRYETDFHKICVKDNGIGFDEKYADQIFTVFKRLHSSKEFEGTGIGLSICKKVIEKYDGDIFAEGMPGEGAIFTIVMPVDNDKNTK